MLPFSAEQAPPPAGSAVREARAPLPGTGGVWVERVGALAMEEHLQAWASLARRALEPNVFMEPGFAFPAVLHLPPNQRPGFLLCWEPGPEEEAPVLIGVLALQAGALGVLAVAQAWSNPQWVASAPLLHRTRAAAALDAMLGWLATQRRFRAGLLVRGVPEGGALMRLLADGGRRRALTLAIRARAVLAMGAAAPAPAPRSAKHAKELRRQARRLGGAVHTAATPEEVRAATENFLELEARGWKGGRGTALLADSHLATFTRAMTRVLAAQGLCRIHTLAVDGQPVAMGIVLRSGDRAFFWKTAYDEARHRLSPGKQLALGLVDLYGTDATLAMVDSCAVPDHPMIDGVWAGRMNVADVLVACPGEGAFASTLAAVALRAEARLRRRAKAVRDLWRRR